ncbi:MAG: hypothetical protein ACI9KE_002447 [Polyangiales bacterium]|jgi:hypothetical protein
MPISPISYLPLSRRLASAGGRRRCAGQADSFVGVSPPDDSPAHFLRCRFKWHGQRQRCAPSKGAAMATRRPEDTLLHALVSEHWPRFKERAEAQGGLPKFVEEEFDAYLRCGIHAREPAPRSERTRTACPPRRRHQASRYSRRRERVRHAHPDDDIRPLGTAAACGAELGGDLTAAFQISLSVRSKARSSPSMATVDIPAISFLSAMPSALFWRA